MEIKLPDYVEGIINTINKNNHSAYIVGGCVRDSIMGITPHDWDIATNATPDEVEDMFAHTIPTGKKYGTITVGWTEEQTGREYLCEVTTFRADGTYSDGRRPDSVTFGTSIIDDLSRRDFTINAMAYNPLVGLIDPYNGVKDIENKIVRCVGNTELRFKEDGLRVLRAIRFASRFEFALSYSIVNYINESGYDLIKNVSYERIHSELVKILSHKYFETFVNGLSKFLYKLFDLDNLDDLKDFKVLSRMDLTIANLFKNTKLYLVEIWLRKFKFTNNEVKSILSYIKAYNYLSEKNKTTDKITATYVKECCFYNGVGVTQDVIEEILQDKQMATVYNNCKNDPIYISDLAITGADIQQQYANIPHEQYGDIFKKLVRVIWVNRNNNNKDYLMKEVKKIYETNN